MERGEIGKHTLLSRGQGEQDKHSLAGIDHLCAHWTGANCLLGVRFLPFQLRRLYEKNR